jgi:hypothetical protein
MSTRQLTFEGGESKMDKDEALKEIEDREIALLDAAETSYLPSRNKSEGQGMNFRMQVDAMIPNRHIDNESIGKQAAEHSYLWQKIKSRLPEKEDRDLLVKAYQDFFLPPLLDEYGPLWQKQDDANNGKTHFTTAEGERLHELGQQIDSAQKLVEFLEIFELAESRGKAEKYEKENREELKEKQKKSDEILSQKLFEKFMEGTADLAEEVGVTLRKKRNSAGREQAANTAKTISHQIIELCPTTKDRALLLQRVETEELKLWKELNTLRAEYALHEMSEEQIEEESIKLTEYQRIKDILAGLRRSI